MNHGDTENSEGNMGMTTGEKTASVSPFLRGSAFLEVSGC